jgi:2-dehydro-3-deoxy-L-fuconate 4-dehydrogenase
MASGDHVSESKDVSGKADEIAVLALYLASDENSFITGQTRTIDGGWVV